MEHILDARPRQVKLCQTREEPRTDRVWRSPLKSRIFTKFLTLDLDLNSGDGHLEPGLGGIVSQHGAGSGRGNPGGGREGEIAIGTWRFAADWLWLIGGVENQRFDPRDPFVQFVDLAIQGFNLRCHPIVKAADAGLNGGKLSEHQASEDKADGNDRYPILHGRIIPGSGTGG